MSASTAPGSARRATASILKNVSANWAGLVVNILLSFFLAPIVVSRLGNTYYGIWTLLMQFTGYLWLFDFGVRESVVKYVAQYHASGQRDELVATVRTALSVYTVVGVVALLCVGGLTVAMPYVFNVPAEAVSTARITAFIAGATIAQSFVSNVFVGIVLGLQRSYRLVRVNIVLAVVRSTILYVLLINGYGIIALAVVQFGMSIASSVMVYRLCREELPYLTARLIRPERGRVLKLLHYGKYVLISNIGDKIIFATDSMVVAAYLPISMLTYYAIGGSLIEYFRSMTTSLATVVNPVASSLEAGNDSTALKGVLLGGTKASVAIGLPVCIGFIMLGETFINLWMGPSYGAQAGAVLAVLAVGHLVNLPYYTISGILYGLGQHRHIAIYRILEGAVNLGLSITLVQSHGLVGVALGTAVPQMVVAAALLPRMLATLLPFSLPDYYRWTYLRPFVAAIPFVATCWFIAHVVRPAGLVAFMASVACGLVTYVIPCWLVVLAPGERERVRGVVLQRLRLAPSA